MKKKKDVILSKAIEFVNKRFQDVNMKTTQEACIAACKDMADWMNSIPRWHIEEEESIYDSINDWSYHRFSCLMKDGTLQMFTGMADENCEGERSVHIYGISDDYDDVDEIVMWVEIPNIKEQERKWEN